MAQDPFKKEKKTRRFKKPDDVLVAFLADDVDETWLEAKILTYSTNNSSNYYDILRGGQALILKYKQLHNYLFPYDSSTIYCEVY